MRHMLSEHGEWSSDHIQIVMVKNTVIFTLFVLSSDLQCYAQVLRSEKLPKEVGKDKRKEDLTLKCHQINGNYRMVRQDEKLVNIFQ